MSTLKILLADADEDSRIALEQDLEQERSLEVVGSTGDGMDAIKLIRELSKGEPTREDTPSIEIRVVGEGDEGACDG